MASAAAARRCITGRGRAEPGLRGMPPLARTPHVPLLRGNTGILRAKSRIVLLTRTLGFAHRARGRIARAFTGNPNQRALLRVELTLTVEGYSSSVKRTVEFAM